MHKSFFCVLLSTVTATKKHFMALVTSHLSMMHATTGNPPCDDLEVAALLEVFRVMSKKERGKSLGKDPKG